MDVDLNSWYRCQIDKKEFKKLCKKSDWQGFKHMIIYFSSLLLFGYLAYASWGTWWCLLWIWLYGVLGDGPEFRFTDLATAGSSRPGPRNGVRIWL